MPITVPGAYTDATLAAYMAERLGEAATMLSLLTADDLRPAIEETLSILSLSSVSAASDLRALRAVARREAFRYARPKLITAFDFRDETESYSRSQLFRNFSDAAAEAESAACVYDPLLSLGVARVERPRDAYDGSWLQTERTL